MAKSRLFHGAGSRLDKADIIAPPLATGAQHTHKRKRSVTESTAKAKIRSSIASSDDWMPLSGEVCIKKRRHRGKQSELKEHRGRNSSNEHRFPTDERVNVRKDAESRPGKKRKPLAEAQQ